MRQNSEEPKLAVSEFQKMGESNEGALRGEDLGKISEPDSNLNEVE